MPKNPIVELGELMQEDHGENLKFTKIEKEGPDHIPTITATLQLPADRGTFVGVGKNKKLAKRDAAKKALKALYPIGTN